MTLTQTIIGCALCIWLLLIFILAANASSKQDFARRTSRLKKSLEELLKMLKG